MTLFVSTYLLLVGKEVLLPMSRSLVFKWAGFDAIVVNTPEAAKLALTELDIRGVVLCHSVSPEESTRIVSDAAQIRPGAPTKQLVEGCCEPAKLVAWARSLGWSVPTLEGSSQYGPTN